MNGSAQPTRKAVLAAVLAVGILAPAVLAAMPPPASAQLTSGAPPRTEAPPPSSDQQDPISVATDLNLRRSRLFEAGNIPGAAALYTQDASYVQLMPILQAFRGREEIRGHLEDLAGASASRIVPSVVRALRNPDGTILVTGDYLVVTRYGPEAEGRFVQTLRHEDGTWRIAMHAFARPHPITAAELDAYNGD